MNYVSIIPKNNAMHLLLGRFPQLPEDIAQRLSQPIVPHIFVIERDNAEKYLSERFKSKVKLNGKVLETYEYQGRIYFCKEDLDQIKLEELVIPKPIQRRPLDPFTSRYRELILRTEIPLEEFTEVIGKKISYLARRIKKRIPEEMEIEDLESEAWIRVMGCLERYEPNAVKFLTFVDYRIHGAMVDYLRSRDLTSRRERKHLREVEKQERLLWNRLGRKPLDSEIAEALEISLEEYQNRIHEERKFVQPKIIDGKVEQLTDIIDKASLGDLMSLEDSDVTANKELLERVRIIAQRLPERKRNILRLYYEEEKEQQEIAQIYGITISRISQILKECREWIKKELEKELFPSNHPDFSEHF
jgi:RNA polymerase sigma factor for flagellar operon FliA